MSTDGSLRQLYRKHLPMIDWQPVETWSTGRGVPDVNFCVNGIEGWIENKITSGWKVKVRPEQVGWAERRTRAGGRVFIAVRAKGPERDELWLLRAGAARLLVEGARLTALPSEAVLGRWLGGPARWDWNAFAAAIQRPLERPAGPAGPIGRP